jgi:hypothetical protein
LIALPVIRALIPAQPQARSIEISKTALAQAANAPAAPAPLSIGRKVAVVTMANWASCKSFDDTKRLSELIRSDDMVAVSHFIAIKEPAGECRYLPKGTVVTVEHSNWYGYYCIRPEGDIDRLWADRPMLEDAATAAAVSTAISAATKPRRRLWRLSVHSHAQDRVLARPWKCLILSVVEADRGDQRGKIRRWQRQ